MRKREGKYLSRERGAGAGAGGRRGVCVCVCMCVCVYVCVYVCVCVERRHIVISTDGRIAGYKDIESRGKQVGLSVKIIKHLSRQGQSLRMKEE